MKITLSKSQWQLIGQKTRWIKEAQNPYYSKLYTGNLLAGLNEMETEIINGCAEGFLEEVKGLSPIDYKFNTIDSGDNVELIFQCTIKKSNIIPLDSEISPELGVKSFDELRGGEIGS